MTKFYRNQGFIKLLWHLFCKNVAESFVRYLARGQGPGYITEYGSVNLKRVKTVFKFLWVVNVLVIKNFPNKTPINGKKSIFI